MNELDQRDFGELRQMLQSNTTSTLEHLLPLLFRAWARNPEYYNEVWIPYLQSFDLPALPDTLDVVERTIGLFPQTAEYARWKRLGSYDVEQESDVPEHLRDDIDLVVKRLVTDSTLADFQMSIGYYQSDSDEPPPYTTPGTYSSQYMLHPLTFTAIDSEDYCLDVVEIDAASFGTLVSVYAGIYGCVVHQHKIIAHNCQGYFSPVDEHAINMPYFHNALRIITGWWDENMKPIEPRPST